MKLRLPKRTRIILLFLLGIGLPSLLLGYLAFRGVQNDQALIEQARLDEHRRTAERVVGFVDEKITAVEETVLDATSDSAVVPEGELAKRLESFIDEHPLVEHVFFFQDSTTIHFPAAELLYFPDGLRSSSSASPKRLSMSAPMMQSAERLEFKQRNYPQALTAYQQAIEQAADLNSKGELLNALARVQKKSALFNDAITTYRKISADFGDVTISDGIPLGLAARLELGSLFQQTGAYSSALESFIELYRLLIHREWTLEKATFEFYAARVRDSISEIFSKPPPDLQLQPCESEFRSLQEEEKERKTGTERILAFEESAAPDLEAKISHGPTEPGMSASRFTLDIGRHSYLVSMLGQTAKTGDEPESSWGIILDPERIREDVLKPALRQYAPAEETAWVVKGRDGGALLTSETPATGGVSVRTDFMANFPDWSVEFYQPPPPLLSTFLLSRHGIYFYMFLLITGILVFGSVLTVRAVSRELELAKMKSDFVSTISHEFKSPLTSIRQLAEMLHSGRVPSEERRRQYYDVLLEQSERLSLLTENILNLARIEEGRKEFVFEDTDVRTLLRQIVSSIQDRVRHEGFSIELEMPKDLPMIRLDRVAMAQVVTNLIDNAVKYSGESKRICVSASGAGPFLTVAVRDFGIGIRNEDLDRVFERFFRGGDALTRTVKGSGLGLTLVREIVEAHHGTVHAESEPGEGSTFSIKLPLSRGEEK
jgi:signal transduction histidine kinase/tetratricopeptide (TPR) repeat protein